VNEWAGVFLGVIAGATLVMALIQIGAVLAILKVARQAQESMATIQRDVRPLLADVRPMLDEAKPIITRANEIASEASRTMTIATAQAQKVDHMVSDLTRRVEETAAIVQQAIVVPAGADHQPGRVFASFEGGRQVGHDRAHALGIRPRRLGGFLRLAQLGRRDHLHGLGDLLRRADAGDPVS
jgi:hypothetical protein